MRFWLPTFLSALTLACAGSNAPRHTAAGSPAQPPPIVTSPAAAPLAFVHDDIPKAADLAAAQHKILFVDAWAPWCHTCLSVKHYVLTDPSLRPYAQHVVFAAVDTDREQNAPFLEQFDVRVWPSFFVIDPRTNRILSFWPGAVSVRELRQLLDDALALTDADTDPSDPRHLLAEARAALAKGQLSVARARFSSVIDKTPASWPRRSDALAGMMWTLYRDHDHRACVLFGQQHLAEVRGAAVPADYCYVLLACAQNLRDGPDRESARAAAIARLRTLVDQPPFDASIDDQADALAILADALRERGDDAGFRAMHEKRLALMEGAAARAPDPQTASTFDYGRAKSYVALGRGDQAIAMLVEREAQLPDAYEPPARLADVLLDVGRHEEALAAIDRALMHAYGPRRLRYLDTKATILGKLGRHDEMLEMLRAVIAGREALARGQADEKALAAARERLRAAEQGTTP